MLVPVALTLSVVDEPELMVMLCGCVLIFVVLHAINVIVAALLVTDVVHAVTTT
jgi:hypothetical protein